MRSAQSRILVIEPDAKWRNNFTRALAQTVTSSDHIISLRAIPSPKETAQFFRAGQPDLVVLNPTETGAQAALLRIAMIFPKTRVLVMADETVSRSIVSVTRGRSDVGVLLHPAAPQDFVDMVEVMLDPQAERMAATWPHAQGKLQWQ